MAATAKRPQGAKDSPAGFEYDRLAITLPRPIAQKTRGKVAARKAPSVSAYVAQALEEKLERDQLRELLAEMAQEFGPPTPEEQQWADSILRSFRKKG